MNEPYEIPTSWRWSQMGKVSTVVGGGTPDTRNSGYFGGEVPWLTPADLSGYTAKYVTGGARTITREGLQSSGARLLPSGSVLFSSRAPIGYVAVAANPISTNQGFKSFVLENGLQATFIYYYLLLAKPLATRLASGTTFLEISGKNAALLPVPVAPFREQSRIADALDEILSDLDAAIGTLRALQGKLKIYRASVLKAAVDGTLTAEWRARAPPDEPAGDLLQRILAERRRRWEQNQLAKFEIKGKEPPKNWKAKYRQPSQPHTANLPPVPKGWSWVAWEQVGFS